MADGIITRQDLITDDALQFGEEYAKSVKTIIDSNEQIKKSAKEVFEIYKDLKKVTSQEQFVEAKRKQTLATIEAKDAIKLQEEALKSSERVKREALKTDQATAKAQKDTANQVHKTNTAWKEQDQLEKNLISTKKKVQLASESTNKALIAEREQLRRENLEIKRSLTFLGQLTSKRDRAREAVQEFQAKQALGKRLSDQEQKELRESTKEFAKYDLAVRKIRESTNQFQGNVGNYPKLFGSVRQSIQGLIPVLGVAGAIRAVFGVIGDATRIVRAFDKQMIAVQKTTGLADKDIAELRREIVALGLDTKGISIDGLTEAAEVAGQLGVKGTKNILKFAKSVELLRASAKGIGEETVADFAKFIEVSDDSAENADRLASVVSDLGNNFATTEKEVINSSIEIQKGVQIYNVAAQEVLGLAAATTSLGVQDAAARTSIRKTFNVIDQAIKTGKNLTDVLEITGLTQEELSDQFEKDATGTFVKFLKGLNRITNDGGNTQVVLEGMKLAGDRVAPTLLSLAEKNELVADAVARANQEYVLNEAALREAELASQSLDANMEELGKSWQALVLSVEDGGGTISEVFKGIVGFLDGAVKGMILFNETFDDTLARVGRESQESSEQFELGFLATLDPTEAEEFAIRQLDRTDEQIELERKRLEELKKQQAEYKEQQTTLGKITRATLGLPDGSTKFNDEIEESTRRLALLQGKLAAYDKLLGITGDSVDENTESTEKNNEELVRNVAHIRSLIKAEKEKLEGATNRQEAKVIQDRIKELQKELEAILGVEVAARKRSRAEQDAFNLAKQRAQLAIQEQERITGNSDLNVGNRLNSSVLLFRERIKLLNLEKDQALKLAKGRKDEETRIEEKYTADLKALVIKRESDVEKVLADAFNKSKTRIQQRRELENRSTAGQEQILRDQLNRELQDQSKSLEERLRLQEQFEDDLAQLKLEAAVTNLEAQIQQVEAELQVSTLSFEQRKELEIQLAALKQTLSAAELEITLDDLEKKREAEERLQEFKQQKIRETSEVIAESFNLDADNLQRFITGITEGFDNALDAVASSVSVVGDIFNSMFDANINKIDEQIQASDEFYERQIALAEGDRDQQDALRAEQELKRQELEKKKRLEQQKQAKFQKALAVAQIGFNTAQAILGIWAQVPKFDFGISAGILTGFVAALGAAQIAAVLARPIPKFQHGTDFHEGGLAEVAEVRPEVIKEPGKEPYIQRKRAILDLPRGTQVIKSIDEYKKMESDALYSSFNRQLGGILAYNNIVSVNNDYSDVVDELRETRKVIKQNKPNIYLPKPAKVDFPHEVFRSRNIDWGE